jgi:hypothetical protein
MSQFTNKPAVEGKLFEKVEFIDKLSKGYFDQESWRESFGYPSNSEGFIDPRQLLTVVTAKERLPDDATHLMWFKRLWVR